MTLCFQKGEVPQGKGPGLPLLFDLPPVLDRIHAQLLSYWTSLGETGSGLPSMTHFDPVAVPEILANVWIADAEPGLAPGQPGRFRMRLAGEEINRIFGASVRGRYFDEILPKDQMEKIHARYHRVLGEPSIMHFAGPVYQDIDQVCTGERLVLPMRGRSGAPDTVIGTTTYDFRSLPFAGANGGDRIVDYQPQFIAIRIRDPG